MRGRVGLEDRQHARVLVAEHELDGAVLVRLEPARVAEHPAELRRTRSGVSVASTDHCSVSVFWMCLTRAMHLSAGASSSARSRSRAVSSSCSTSFSHSSVVWCWTMNSSSSWCSGREIGRCALQQRGQVEVAAVAHAVAEVGDDGCLDRAGVRLDAVAHVLVFGHALSLAARCAASPGAVRRRRAHALDETRATSRRSDRLSPDGPYPPPRGAVTRTSIIRRLTTPEHTGVSDVNP